MPKYNFVGQRFDRLLVIEKVPSIYSGRSAKSRFKCKCDCGVIKDINGASLKNGVTRSCGCLRKDINKLNLKGKPSATRLKFGQSSFNKLYSQYKISARKTNKPFTLLKDIFEKIVSNNCYYCGAFPSTRLKLKNSYGEYVFNGIDRVNNLKGYTEDNVVTCCKMCNYMKKAFTQEQFLNHIKEIYICRIQQ